MDKRWLIIFMFAFLLNGCQRDLPEPEVIKIIPLSEENSGTDLPVTAAEKYDEFDVRYHVEGDNVYIECIVPNISFRDHSKNQGKIVLYVNGQKKEEVSSAAFIIKGLPKGRHQLRLEVIDVNNKTLLLEKEFFVTIS